MTLRKLVSIFVICSFVFDQYINLRNRKWCQKERIDRGFFDVNKKKNNFILMLKEWKTGRIPKFKKDVNDTVPMYVAEPTSFGLQTSTRVVRLSMQA